MAIYSQSVRTLSCVRRTHRHLIAHNIDRVRGPTNNFIMIYSDIINNTHDNVIAHKIACVAPRIRTFWHVCCVAQEVRYRKGKGISVPEGDKHVTRIHTLRRVNAHADARIHAVARPAHSPVLEQRRPLASRPRCRRVLQEAAASTPHVWHGAPSGVWFSVGEDGGRYRRHQWK